jgi:hypothetical protein
MPEQIWDMIKWVVIIVVGISCLGYWTQKIINFLTTEIEKETNE